MNYETVKLNIPNTRGLKLATEIYKPKKDGKVPVVFIFHGFTGYKESIDLVDIANKLAYVGIASVRFTSSGFGDSEGTLDHDYSFSNYRLDAESVFRYVSELSYINKSQIGLYGHSMGGKLTALIGQNHPDIHALCIVSAPVSFNGTLYGNLKEKWQQNGYLEKISGRDNKAVRIPYDYFLDEQKKEHDVLVAARKITSPHVLVIAGMSDIEVPWQETKKIFSALKCKKEFLLLEGVDHKYKYNPKLIPVVHNPVVSFFKKYL